ncbi:hypothetical protein [Polaromonas sp. YR568]|uniref:hypothetical protein n=1 Tax=Polaromonas sp. YR568 TaxID=1855301 RepID=UPI003137F2E2
MKVAPVSGDLLVKLALAAAVVGVGVVLVRRAGAALPGLPDLPSFDSVVQSFNPASDQNLAYTGVNALGNAIVDASGPGRSADGSWSLGYWIYDVTHPAPFTPGINPAAPLPTVQPSPVQDDFGSPIYPYA